MFYVAAHNPNNGGRFLLFVCRYKKDAIACYEDAKKEVDLYCQENGCEARESLIFANRKGKYFRIETCCLDTEKIRFSLEVRNAPNSAFYLDNYPIVKVGLWWIIYEDTWRKDYPNLFHSVNLIKDPSL